MKMMGKILAVLIILFSQTVGAQTAGTLITTGIFSPLNPDGNSWVTSNSYYYFTDDQSESEIDWV